MNRFTPLAIIFAIIILPACTMRNSPNTAELSEIKPENKTESVVYIYRPYSMSNIMLSPEVFINDKKIGEVKNNSYLYVRVLPGKHSLELKLDARYSGVQQLELNAWPGQSIFIRVNTALKFEMNKPYSRSFNFQQVDKKNALSDIQKMQYAGEENIDKIIEEKTQKVAEEKQQSEGQYSISKSRNPFSK
jgi:uncharacterized protein DUF2846